MLSLTSVFLLLHPGEVKDSTHFRYAEETKLAWQEGRLSNDIMAEHRKLTKADIIIFQVVALQTPFLSYGVGCF